jgi:hypothetical protein
MTHGIPDITLLLARWVSVPPLRGNRRLVVAIAAVAAPTMLRAVASPAQGDGFCAYLPFLSLVAFAVDWRTAAALAVICGLVADYLFEGTPRQFLADKCEIMGIIYFGVAAALVIGLSQAFRKAVADPLWLADRGAHHAGLVFSRRAGQACVSWYGGRSFVPLGPADEVEAMMRDFLAQQELGRRLSGPSAVAPK